MDRCPVTSTALKPDGKAHRRSNVPSRTSRSRSKSRNPSPRKQSSKQTTTMILEHRKSKEERSQSPRRKTSLATIELDQKLASTRTSSKETISCTSQSSRLNKYKIPKKSTVLDSASESSVSKSDQTVEAILKAKMPSLLNNKERKEANVRMGNVKTLEERDSQRKQRQPLQAKRRLAQNSASNLKCKSEDDILRIPKKGATNTTKVFADLPDYEDSLDQDDDDEGTDADLNNPIPKILKMVKDDNNNGVGTEPHGPVVSEVTAMDVDIDVHMDLSPPLASSKIIVVPDTNIWINNLGLIETIVNKDFAKPVIIVIPWMVLQELDVGLHQKAKPGQSLAQMRRPVQYIHSLLASNHPKIKGQKAYEAAISKLKFDEIVADDSILNCAVQNLKINTTVIFLSNDKNLLNKALVNEIIACSSGNAMDKITEAVLGSNLQPRTPCLPFSPPSSFLIPSASTNSVLYPPNLAVKRRLESSDSNSSNDSLDYILDNNNDVEMQEEASDPSQPLCKVRAVGNTFSSSFKPEEADSFQALESALLKAFSYIIRRKMIEDYGMGGWEYALKIKPPWTLVNAVKCMLVHWIANFSYVFSRRGQTHLESLKPLVESHKYARSDSRKRLEERIIDTCISLFNFLHKDFEEADTIVECRRILLELSLPGANNSFDVTNQSNQL
ncbi:transcriptional protein SWT1 isoform X2 [Folsomia candida]|uniref:transcriptional protein SWT1 isoform X2 n=1 Tax=Folsomia candida TaxID=158441 RepID=UPI000B8F81AB|nr:transcriptional protein SWT1 isoform X2 [Folsomia candida]